MVSHFTVAAAVCSLYLTTCLAGNYNYGDVLGKSILFYEAQRSGKLPSNNRIPWRGDSFLNDKGVNGEDLTGGYFDAGDFVKFIFPMASSMTFLAWSLVDNKAGYDAAGEYNNGLAALKWGTDNLIKMHPSANVFYCQVGDGDKDHASWGRPEDWPQNDVRPAYRLSTDKPGSDAAGEAAAALAAASIAFKASNPSYSQTLLTHAQQLYTFANTYRGKYSDSYPQVQAFYNSWSGYGDELAWAAAWLYRATNSATYKTDIERHWNEFGLNQRPSEASWDLKIAQFQVLMAKIDGSSKYKDAAKSFCDWIVNSAKKTPLGLVVLADYGALRHAANVAAVCLQAGAAGINTAAYNAFAKKQIDYMLGDSKKSYVVGFSTDANKIPSPKRPHHRGSSCPNRPAACGWNDYNNPDSNPQTLTGALVGGPDANDGYTDKRDDFVKNEVALDYNAGFQAALAALNDLKAKKAI